MNCQNCDAPVLASDERCERCGAKLLHRRIFFGAPKNDQFALTGEEPEQEPTERPANDDLDLLPRSEYAPRPSLVTDRARTPERSYAGFWRRLGAFIIDVLMIALLCAVMGGMAYVAYKVGLAAHQRKVSFGNATPLLSFFTFGVVLLASAYFVVFHGMAGQTVGKSLLRLRVIGPEQDRVTYGRALLRWIATVGFGCLSFGVSFLWIIWSGEKRGWHDYLARTWVVRE
jgi:uncharacterized RDD family membrane protein YckC